MVWNTCLNCQLTIQCGRCYQEYLQVYASQNVHITSFWSEIKSTVPPSLPFPPLGVVSMVTPSTLATAPSVSRSWWEMLPRTVPGRDRRQMNSCTLVHPVCVIINCVSSYLVTPYLILHRGAWWLVLRVTIMRNLELWNHYLVHIPAALVAAVKSGGSLGTRLLFCVSWFSRIFQQTAIHTSYHSCIIVEWDMASKSSTHTTVTLCCSFLPAASGSSGLGFGKFNMKKKVFATAKGSVFVTPWDQMQNHMQSHYHYLSATFQPICISHIYTCTHTYVHHITTCAAIYIAHIHIHAHT